ncbi:hypothetical protein P8Q88_06605 [Qipengyuania sp. XHP0207]|uniref:hypothetical protein n=1 Tax=Qipengyuania sp. XHP0207 TaxID=3038078 RepID=UPI00241C5AF3|nr:hypothetical protein [Qipengyuania sp. XHP0207]MDG5747846.1 hypothetical protein [Qipengyuania sp. XHP0207]
MSSEPIPIEAPGGFAPVLALGRDDGTGHLALVSPQAPLPVVASAPAATEPLEGTTSVAMVAGPFEPAAFAPVYLTLTGDWKGEVRMLRSTDGGVTKAPVTLAGATWGLYTADVCEPVWQESEAGAQLWLDVAPISGTLAYRLAQ